MSVARTAGLNIKSSRFRRAQATATATTTPTLAARLAIGVQRTLGFPRG